MPYIISFLEGIITFVSPCLLPLLPMYIFYFAGGSGQEHHGKQRAFLNSIGFVLGFTLVFLLMGAFAGTIGGWLKNYQTEVNIVTGVIVVIFGLHFLGVFRLSIFDHIGLKKNNVTPMGFLTNVLFGIVFSVSWTPCVGVFLGSALMLASHQGSAAEGMLMLLCYSLGLGIPFVISAVLIDKLKHAFQFIKRHYGILNKAAGGILVVMGLLMMTGYMGRLLSLLSV